MLLRIYLFNLLFIYSCVHSQIIEEGTGSHLKHYFIVLDSTPRTLAFVSKDSPIAFSFNLETLSLHKIWKADKKGAISFSGSVYDYRHGPNPRRIGKNILTVSSEKEAWSINKRAKHRYYSFSREKESVVVKSFFLNSKGEKIWVKDKLNSKKNNLYRTITVDNLKNAKIKVFLGSNWNTNLSSFFFRKGLLTINKSGTYSFSLKIN